MNHPEIRMVPVDALIPYARNARTHSDAQVAQIAASIVEFGWTNPILIDGSKGVIAGHGRLMAARKLEHKEVPVIELSHLSPEQKKAYILADNRLAENAGWDTELLKLELAELKAVDFDMELMGFGDKELDELLGMNEEGGGLTEDDAIPELMGTFMAGGKGLNPFSEENQATLKTALDKRNAIVEKANKNYVDLWKMPLLADAVKQRFEEINKGEEEAHSDKPKLNYSSATNVTTAAAMSKIESEVKQLQAMTDVESGLLKDRQKIIDLYETQGYISFKQASDARLNAQQDFTEKLGALYGQEESILKQGLATVAKTAQDKIKLQDKLNEVTLKRQKLERDAQQSNLERDIKLPGETLKDITEQVARAQGQLRATEEQIKVLKDSGAISEIESLKRLSDARKSSAGELAELAAKAREMVEATPGNDKLAESFRRIEEAARQAADGAKLLGQRALELSEPGAGFAKALRTLGEETEQVGKQIEAVTTKAFNGMTDALTNFVMTGKLDFHSLATSIISDLIKIQIQKSITMPMANALGSFFGFANGGIMTSGGPLPLRAYASGGVASTPQLAVFGEGSKPEAYVPLPDGRSIPVTMKAGSSGSDVFNISVSVSEAGTSVSGSQGKELGKAISSAVRQELLNQKRAGGLLDPRKLA